MSNGTRSGGSKGALALILSVSLVAGISGLSAGRGNLGRETPLSGNVVGGKEPAALLTPGKVEVTIGPDVFTVSWISGDTTSSIRTRLLTAINDPNFSYNATAYVDPLDPNDVSFEVLTDSNAEIPRMQVCETFADIWTLATGFAMGKDRATFLKATTINGVNADPNLGAPVYTLRVATWDHGIYSNTYTTSVAPNNTATGLNLSIRTDLEAAGYTVVDDGATFTVSRSADMITNLKIFSTDTGVHDNCILLAPTTGAVPTVSQTGMFVLVLILTLSAVVILRRKGGRAHPL